MVRFDRFTEQRLPRPQCLHMQIDISGCIFVCAARRRCQRMQKSAALFAINIIVKVQYMDDGKSSWREMELCFNFRMDRSIDFKVDPRIAMRMQIGVPAGVRDSIMPRARSTFSE
jgi:hypothetical protein